MPPSASPPTATTTTMNNNKASPRKSVMEDGPIQELVYIVEETKPEQWQKRTAALEEFVAQIPTGHEYGRHEAWYNSPGTLRNAHLPIGQLLKDPRSTVVKRTCEALAQLFSKCQGDARFLFKDLMPVVLDVHAQTVQVIRSQVQTMVLDAIPIVPCKMAMPLWLERLKTDKSRTVREACVLYLGVALKEWTCEDSAPETGGVAYLTEENWIQIATILIKTLRDPSPTVRTYAKSGIATIRDAQPELWNDLIRKRDGPAGNDIKLQKWLIKVSESGSEELNVNEELSVASRYSHYSQASKRGGAPSTPNSRSNLGGGFNANRPSSRGRAAAVPVQINVGGGAGGVRGVGNNQEKQPARQMRGLGPPLRRPFAQVVDSSPSKNANNNTASYPVPQLGTPPRPPGATPPQRGRQSSLSQQRSPSPSPRRPETRHRVPLRSRSASSAGSPVLPPSDPSALGGDNDNNNMSSAMGSARGRARPTPEALNPNSAMLHNHHHSNNNDTHKVIDLSDQPSPQYQMNQQDQDFGQEDPDFGSGVYSNVTSTEMLDVTKSIDQTLAHPFLQQQQQQQSMDQYHQQLQQPAQIEGDDENPFINSMNELKEHASKRRSRRSLKLQERWSRQDSIGENIGSPIAVPVAMNNTASDAMSSLGGASIVDNINNAAAMIINSDTKRPIDAEGLAAAGPAALPEHYIIAEQLLRAHKTHVDQIMETLKIEMDTLRDFEQSLEQEQAPTQEQVLNYFESVGLCLDQRTTAGNILQREMDRIAKGAFQNAPAAAAHPTNGSGGAMDC